MNGFRPLMSRACAHSPRRDREWCARPTEGECGRAKKTSRLRSRDGRQDGHSLPSHHKITFWSGNFTPCRVVLPVGDGRQYSQAQTKRVSSLRFHQFGCQTPRNLPLGGGKRRCGCNFCTSFLCLKMADRPLWLEQQVPCQQEFTLISNPPALLTHPSVPLLACPARPLLLADLECLRRVYFILIRASERTQLSDCIAG